MWVVIATVSLSLALPSRSIPTESSHLSSPGLTSPAEALTVNYMPNPWGLDTLPSFSWKIPSNNRGVSQSAYRIQVFTENNIQVWDSTTVASSSSLHIPYAGSPLSDNSRYFWNVAYQTIDGSAAPVAASTFHTGLTAWTPSWIQSPIVPAGAQGCNVFRTEFDVSSESRNTLFITGLGYYSVYLNGKSVGQRVLEPGWTAYNKRALYSTYDLTHLAQPGSRNVLRVMLGRGWYVRDGHGNSTFAISVQTRNNLHATSSPSVELVSSSDPNSWKCVAGPITDDDVYDGESYDARLEHSGWDALNFDDSSWLTAVTTATPPVPVLSSQVMPPIRVITEKPFINMTEPESGTFVFDLGVHFSGFSELSIQGPAGAVITLRHAEILLPDHSGNIKVDELRSAKATDSFVLRGSGTTEVFRPSFTYHGFRFVELTHSGMPEGWSPTLASLLGILVHSDIETVGHVTFGNSSDGLSNTGVPSASTVLNRVQDIVVRSLLTNSMSVQSDCDQRDERKGWMGDAALSSDVAFHNFQMGAFMTNWLRTMLDEQNDDGAMPDTAPFIWGSRDGDPNWGTAYPTTVHNMLVHYGDVGLVQDHYFALKKYMSHAIGLAKAGMASYYVEYGDWVPPPPATKVDGHFTSAFAFLRDLRIFAEMADAVGDTRSADDIRGLFVEYAAQFNTAFFSPATGVYLDGMQTAQVLPLWLDIVPVAAKAALIDHVVKDILEDQNVHVTTGIIGVKYLMLALAANGRQDVVAALAAQTSYPSWGYMIFNDIEPSTTVWELWNAPSEGPGMNSRNHHMYSSVGHPLYSVLVGMQQANGSSAFQKVLVSPPASVIGDPARSTVSRPLLSQASGSMDTIRGLFSVSWNLTIQTVEPSFQLNVVVPVGSTGTVNVPLLPLGSPAANAVVLTEGGSVIWKDGMFVAGDVGVTGVSFGAVDGQVGPHLVVAVTSGSYQFVAIA